MKNDERFGIIREISDVHRAYCGRASRLGIQHCAMEGDIVMKKTLKAIVLLLAMLLVLIPFTACGDDDPADSGSSSSDVPDDSTNEDPGKKDEKEESYIESVRRINSTDIEVIYSKSYSGSDPRALKFAVTANGSDRLSFNLDYGYGGAIFFDHLLTLQLAEPIEDGAEVKLEHDGVVYDVPYEPYYIYECVSESGVPVYGSRCLTKGEETVKRAAEIVDTLLSESPAIAEQMVKSGAKLAVYGKGEHAYYVPEHRGGYDEASLYVEGFGGITCSITESNVWHWRADNAPDKSYTTAYVNESILVHEFAHGVKIAGIDMMADQSLANEYQMVYRHAVAAGLWPDSYAISNSDEFFATMSAIWFNVMNESNASDTWDGVRGPINTRKELYNYDIVTYNFFAKIYPYTNLDGEWTPVPDTVTITGLATEEAPDYGDVKHTFNYPEAIGFLGIDTTATYKFLYRDAEYILDVSATSTGVGLWWDFMADYPDSAGSMTYNFELVPGKDPVEKDHITTYYVYIKNVRDGYLYVIDDHIYAAAAVDAASLPENPTEFEVALDETGLATIGFDGKKLFVNGDPDNGTETLLSAENASKFYVTDVSATSGNVLFIHNGTVNGSENGAVLVSGGVAELSAPATLDGKSFVKWEASAGTFADASSANTEFTMPEGDAVVWAIYE